MKYYLKSIDETIKLTETSATGLSSIQAHKRLNQNGKNKLIEKKSPSLLFKFFKQLCDPMTIVLLVAAALSLIIALYSNESMTETFIILFVVVANTILGVYQENKAEKAIQSLKELAASTSKVIRDGENTVVKSEDLVVGDIIIIESGDAIPADARIIESMSLKLEESSISGESLPVEKTSDVITLNNNKDVTLNDRINMVYAGSTVVYGRGKAVVVATGMNTEMGKIANYLSEAKDSKTPLQKKLNHLGKVLSFIVIGICAFIFLFSILTADKLNITSVLDIFMIAISLAVAAIPSGLSAVVTIQLAMGVTKMSKQNAIIRKLTAVETLGCTQIICSDKTGTLTQNKMTATDYFSEDKILLSKALALCNDASFDKDDNVTGEPTDVALFKFSLDNLDAEKLREDYRRIDELPFDSERKMMSTLHKENNETFIQYTKGAPDILINKCTKYMINGKEIELTKELKEKIKLENKKMANKALRVICAAMKTYEDNDKINITEENLTFLGLVGMIDPIRPEAKSAVEECKIAGIVPVMITGDHKNTAVAIGLQLGILSDESQAITGAELDNMSDDELKQVIENYSVYARVQPEHKVRIVDTLKSLGKVVAMTGDGVNDAPSIKKADIGIGMGITGTDVTKNVADIILADDNFATIVSAVKEGRRIYENIKKAIQFLLSSNISEITCIFVATVLGFAIFHPIHILWINLVTDTFPALALGVEPEERALMKIAPRSPKESLFSGGLTFNIIYQSLYVSIITLTSYFIGVFLQTGSLNAQSSSLGTTLAFFTLSMSETFHAFNIRSLKGSLFKIKHRNKYLIYSTIFSLVLINIVVLVPQFSLAFGLVTINPWGYLSVLILSLSVIPVVELVKLIQNKIYKKRALK